MAKKQLDKIKSDDIHSGMVVRLRDDTLWLVTRAGQFTKILTNGREWHYLSSWDPETLKSQKLAPPIHRNKRDDSLDIMEVYGLINSSEHYIKSITNSTNHRDLLWSRKKPAVKMTVAEICEKLGYDIEIVKE